MAWVNIGGLFLAPRFNQGVCLIRGGGQEEGFVQKHLIPESCRSSEQKAAVPSKVDVSRGSEAVGAAPWIQNRESWVQQINKQQRVPRKAAATQITVYKHLSL